MYFYACGHTHTHTPICSYTDTHTHTHTQIHRHTHTHMLICSYTQRYTHTDSQTHTHTHIDLQLHTEIHAHRFTATHTQTHSQPHTLGASTPEDHPSKALSPLLRCLVDSPIQLPCGHCLGVDHTRLHSGEQSTLLACEQTRGVNPSGTATPEL